MKRLHGLLLLIVACALPAPALAAARVATLLPCVEEALRGVDGVEIVAGVRSGFRQPERSDVIDLGNPHSPNVERLAGARADWVVGDAAIHAALRESLGRFGAQVVLIDTTSVAGTLDGIASLGARLGAESAVGGRVQQARDALAALRLDEPVSVLPLFGTPGRFQVVTGNAWLGSLLARLGFENLGAGARGAQRIPGYVEVSHEYLATLQPELVVLVAHGDPEALRGALAAKLSEGGSWSRLSASATRGVHVLAPDRFLANPGLALPDVARELVELAAPSTPFVGADAP